MKIILLFALFSLSCVLKAQYFNPGTDPASVRWHQVRSEHFRIIFPERLDSQAVYIANALEYFRRPGSASLDALPGMWPVILHNRTVISNAYTPYAPKRIEMITTPPQDVGDNYAQDWIDQLVIHEFRHTVQYASVNRGLTRALTYLLGQQALPAVLGLFVPWWFIEGDAVITETASTHTGRGRVPAYEMRLRAQFLEKGIYSYDKAVNGSFRDFIPNHYELGYLLAGYTRTEFGKETWSRVMRRTGDIPLIMVPFSNTLYKETGYGKSRLYRYIAASMERDWRARDSSLVLTFFSPARLPGDQHYTSRIQPSVLDDGRTIALKTSLDDIPRIVIIDTSGMEQILFNPGYLSDQNLSASMNKLCYAEVDFDPRWYYRSYSVIRLVDIQSGQSRKITHKTRYFSPDISRDGKRIVTVMADEENRYFLVILDAENGDIIRRIPVPGNHFPDHPSWSADGKHIAVVLTRKEGKCLAVADASSGKFQILLPFSYTEISRPCFFGPYIFFTGAYTGTDNIFAIETGTRRMFQVTSSRFGATDATVSPDGTKISYADYSSGGYSIVTAELDQDDWKEIIPRSVYRWELAEKLAQQEGFLFDSEKVPDSAYPIKPYRKWQNLFNFHSWAPLSVDLDNTEVNPGVMLLSQNLLGSSTAILGYSYDLNEETGKYYLKYSYEGYYPVLDFQVDYGLRRGVYSDTIHDENISYKFNELNLSAGLRVPLSRNVKSWYVGLQPYIGYTRTFRKMVPGSGLTLNYDRLNSLDGQLFLYAQSKRSSMDLQPPWGQQLELNYRMDPFDFDPDISTFSVEALFYLPGMAKHQGIRIYSGYQDRNAEYWYSGLIAFPRGHSGLFADRAFSGSFSYVAPLFYPDWNAGPVFYLKRINAAVFYDMMLDFDNDPASYYQSCGLDCTFDFHLFRLFVPLEAGLRTIFLPGENRFVFEFLYSVNIGDLY